HSSGTGAQVLSYAPPDRRRYIILWHWWNSYLAETPTIVGLDETLIDGMKSVLIYLSIGVSILLSAIGILHSLRE
ncbi:MAG: hypothetical protein COZ70_05640, partial [Deltaproteobacteria bacterium CG_4_8_14_3_um_filter_51_11]